MNRGLRKYARKVVLGIVLLGLAAWIVPAFLSVEHYRHRLQTSLERAVGRPVRFDGISFHLIPLPGFTITNAVLAEVPPFGSEPFAQAERMDCDLRWRSLWDRRLDVSRLTLDGGSLNLVRDSGGGWNIVDLLARSHPKGAVPPGGGRSLRRRGLDIVANDVRLNFAVGRDTQPLAITNVHANLHVDPGTGQVSFHLTGSPVRTDLSMPTPGPVELEGEWTPSASPGGSLDARLVTRGALLYDWIPLLSAHNLGLYGVLESDVRLTGSLRNVHFQGDATLAGLHRWEGLPPSTPLPLTIHFRGNFDCGAGQLQMSSLDVAFARSRLHVSGAVLGLPSSPRLDLVAALERSHLEDVLELVRRATGKQGAWSVMGSVNGMVAVKGAWDNPRWGGFLTARAVRLAAPGGGFPVSRLRLTIDRKEARLAPFRIFLAPNAAALGGGEFLIPRLKKVRGKIVRAGGEYELWASARDLSLRDLLRVGKTFGWEASRHIAAEGVARVNLRLSGRVHPLMPPEFAVRAQLERARLLAPGLTEPINLPRATITIANGRVVAEPVVAVIGTSVFSGRLTHSGSSEDPWEFSIHATRLSLDQGAGWFEAFGENAPLRFLSRLPELGSFLQRRQAALDLFRRLDARGTLTTPILAYRNVNLQRFHAQIEIQHRVLRIEHASFRAGGGRGSGGAVVNFRASPAQLNARLALDGADVRAIGPIFSPDLSGARGSYSIEGQFQARGLSRRQIVGDLRGSGTIRVRNLTLGNFDLLGNLAQFSGFGTLEPQGRPVTIGHGSGRFEIRDRKITLRDAAIQAGGTTVALTGTYTFGGPIHLNVQADLRHLHRVWLRPGMEKQPADGWARLNLIGSFAEGAESPRWSLPVARATSLPPRREAF